MASQTTGLDERYRSHLDIGAGIHWSRGETHALYLGGVGVYRPHFLGPVRDT
jgi:hypothetical protein